MDINDMYKDFDERVALYRKENRMGYFDFTSNDDDNIYLDTLIDFYSSFCEIVITNQNLNELYLKFYCIDQKRANTIEITHRNILTEYLPSFLLIYCRAFNIRNILDLSGDDGRLIDILTRNGKWEHCTGAVRTSDLLHIALNSDVNGSVDWIKLSDIHLLQQLGRKYQCIVAKAPMDEDFNIYDASSSYLVNLLPTALLLLENEGRLLLRTNKIITYEYLDAFKELGWMAEAVYCFNDSHSCLVEIVPVEQYREDGIFLYNYSENALSIDAQSISLLEHYNRKKTSTDLQKGIRIDIKTFVSRFYFEAHHEMVEQSQMYNLQESNINDIIDEIHMDYVPYSNSFPNRLIIPKEFVLFVESRRCSVIFTLADLA